MESYADIVRGGTVVRGISQLDKPVSPTITGFGLNGGGLRASEGMNQGGSDWRGIGGSLLFQRPTTGVTAAKDACGSVEGRGADTRGTLGIEASQEKERFKESLSVYSEKLLQFAHDNGSDASSLAWSSGKTYLIQKRAMDAPGNRACLDPYHWEASDFVTAVGDGYRWYTQEPQEEAGDGLKGAELSGVDVETRSGKPSLLEHTRQGTMVVPSNSVAYMSSYQSDHPSFIHNNSNSDEEHHEVRPTPTSYPSIYPSAHTHNKDVSSFSLYYADTDKDSFSSVSLYDTNATRYHVKREGLSDLPSATAADCATTKEGRPTVLKDVSLPSEVCNNGALSLDDSLFGYEKGLVKTPEDLAGSYHPSLRSLSSADEGGDLMNLKSRAMKGEEGEILDLSVLSLLTHPSAEYMDFVYPKEASPTLNDPTMSLYPPQGSESRLLDSSVLKASSERFDASVNVFGGILAKSATAGSHEADGLVTAAPYPMPTREYNRSRLPLPPANTLEGGAYHYDNRVALTAAPPSSDGNELLPPGIPLVQSDRKQSQSAMKRSGALSTAMEGRFHSLTSAFKDLMTSLSQPEAYEAPEADEGSRIQSNTGERPSPLRDRSATSYLYGESPSDLYGIACNTSLNAMGGDCVHHSLKKVRCESSMASTASDSTDAQKIQNNEEVGVASTHTTAFSFTPNFASSLVRPSNRVSLRSEGEIERIEDFHPMPYGNGNSYRTYLSSKGAIQTGKKMASWDETLGSTTHRKPNVPIKYIWKNAKPVQSDPRYDVPSPSRLRNGSLNPMNPNNAHHMTPSTDKNSVMSHRKHAATNVPMPFRPTHYARLKILVNNSIAGGIIGFKGETLRDLQKMFNIRLDTTDKCHYFPGTDQRVVMLTGLYPNIFEAAEYLIGLLKDEEVKSALELLSITKSDLNYLGYDYREPKCTIKIVAPSYTCNRLLLNAGEEMQRMERTCGTKIYIARWDLQVNGVRERLVIVQGTPSTLVATIAELALSIQRDPLINLYEFMNYDTFYTALPKYITQDGNNGSSNMAFGGTSNTSHVD